jgi:CheY-like chemotaxis protein
MPRRILMVDRDADARKTTRCFLESRTTCEKCLEAANGVDTIAREGLLKPDLILLDYSMPVMNGIEAGAVLHTMLPEVPVILFAGQDTCAIESAAVAISAGICAVISKTDMGTLEEHLRTLFDCNPKPGTLGQHPNRIPSADKRDSSCVNPAKACFR